MTKKRHGGLSAMQVGAAAVLILAAVLVLTIHMNTAITGMSAGEQVRQALFVAKDWQ